MHRIWIQAGLSLALLLAGGIPLLLASLLGLPAVMQLLIVIGLALLLGNVLFARTRRASKGLLALTYAYAGRRFDQRLPIGRWDLLGPLCSAMVDMAQQLASSEQELVRRVCFQSELSRFLRPALAAQIASGERPLMLNGQRCLISVVFVDLVGFNSFAEVAPPTHVVALLQEVMAMMAELIFRHAGILDKSVGDCMMAVFGAPGVQGDHAPRALAAAEDILRFVSANAPRWQTLYAYDVQLSIGVGTGEAIVGDLGSENRLEYSAVGDVVSLAARLAALARPGQILLSAEVADEAPAGFAFNSLGEQALFEGRPRITVLELS